MATPMQLSALNLHKRLCQRLNAGGTAPGTPFTVKLRGEGGTTTSVGLNYHYDGNDPFATLPATTDVLAWVVWEPVPVRAGGSESDPSVGREAQPKMRGQMPYLDTSGNPITLHDEDWVLGPDGVTLYEIEDPVLDPTQSVYYFMMTIQQ